MPQPKEGNAASSTGENREKVSTTVSTRIFRPVASWSWRKSIAQTSLGPRGRLAILTQLRLDPTLRRLVAQLQAQLFVKSIDPLRIDDPAVTAQQNMHAPVALPHAGLADLFDSMLEVGLAAALGLVDVERSIDPKGGASSPDRDLPIASQSVDKFALAGRPQSFFDRTS